MSAAAGRRTFDLDDVRIHALTWGDPGAPLALCLHGYPDTAWTWRHLAPRLVDQGYYVVAPFTRGYGPSTIPPNGDFSVGALVADALDLVSLVDAEDAVLIGHDWGAITANSVAAMHDSPFRRIVALAVPPFGCLTPVRGRLTAQIPQILLQSVSSWYVMVNQLPVVPEKVFGRMTAFLWQTWSPGYDASEDLRYLSESVPDAARRGAVIGYYRSFARPHRLSDRHAAFQNYVMAAPQQPSLQLHGLDDGCLRPRLFDFARGRLPRGSRIVPVSGAGHFLHLEQPGLVGDLITEYLAATAT
ncbi:alpha/beta fold hydrolase [Nocardia miyunensis]|uniref:alpha/beta fold hydrolase n=1 Tax=Nocardia miyunensis TaxID=282684 RepID=UPI0008352F0A|nr:alpha/beta fold hydrolase [Nocardia miyunensis]